MKFNQKIIYSISNIPNPCPLFRNVCQILCVFVLLIPERTYVREDLKGGKGAKYGVLFGKALINYLDVLPLPPKRYNNPKETPICVTCDCEKSGIRNICSNSASVGFEIAGSTFDLYFHISEKENL